MPLTGWTGLLGKRKKDRCCGEHDFQSDVSALACLALAAVALASTVSAGTVLRRKRTISRAKQYIPTIWVDPDGCEHWVMDDGVRRLHDAAHQPSGYSGLPPGQCLRRDEHRISSLPPTATGSARRASSVWRSSFSKPVPLSYIITGHTDSRASDDYNMRLSLQPCQLGCARRHRPLVRVSRMCAATANACRCAQQHGRWHGQEPPCRNHLHSLRGRTIMKFAKLIADLSARSA